jgi:hypothetical protein
LPIFSLFALWTLVQPRFGGENVTSGELNADNWHHQDITTRAVRESGLGFEDEAVKSLQWHSDMIDSYLYNPWFWAKGGPRRVRAALTVKRELEKLHFDDLNSSSQVSTMWQRYLSGTVAGLIWAARRPDGEDVPAAHALIGLSLHALQDFYAHSNWVDDQQRRQQTWFEAFRAANGLIPPHSLYTGTYELPDHLGVKPHGKPAPACSLFQGPGLPEVLQVACAKESPLNKFAVCQMFDMCQQAVPISPTVLGIPLPEGVAYLEPAGIALDSRWQAPIARLVRDIDPNDKITAEELFATAKELALRSSVAWLMKLQTIMEDLKLGDFWKRVKLGKDTWAHRESQLEDHSTMPFLFLSAGHYPPPPSDMTMPETGHWYLWLQVTTGDNGTDGFVYVLYDKERMPHLLDHMPNDSFLLDFNDFKEGSVAAYWTGPRRDLPREITFHHERRDILDVGEALFDAVEDLVDQFLESVSDAFMSLIGGHADEIGTDKVSWSTTELAKIGPDPVPFLLEADGGDEGHYQLRCNIRRTGEGTDPGLAGTLMGDWVEYQVTIDELHCVAESNEPSEEDEVFVLALLANMTDNSPGAVQKFRTQPLDIDEQAEDVPRTRRINHSFAPVRMPRSAARLTMPVAFFESDQESVSTRDELLNSFASRVTEKLEPGLTEIVKTLGATGPGSWRLEHLRVFAFQRPMAEATGGWLFDGHIGELIGPGGRLTIPIPERQPFPLWNVQV